MLAELTILPIGGGEHMTEPLARVVDLVERSGLDHQVTAMGTLVEGPPDRVWALLRRCHEAAREACGRVVTEVRIDDFGGRTHAIERTVERVGEALGHAVRSAPSAAA